MALVAPKSDDSNLYFFSFAIGRQPFEMFVNEPNPEVLLETFSVVLKRAFDNQIVNFERPRER